MGKDKEHREPLEGVELETASTDVDPDETAELIDALQAERDELSARVDELVRALADKDNERKRAVAGVPEARQQGKRDVVRSVLSVIDHFDLALQQDPGKASAEQVIAGVRVIRDELIRALSAQGVATIAPSRGEAFDPMRHEAMMQQPEDGVEPGHIVAVMQAGFTLDGRVVRPAKVSIAPPAAQGNG